MQFYLSSYELGENPERLASLFGANKRIAYIPNARDFVGADPARKNERTRNDMAGLASLGLEPELLDLREYFGNTEGLIAKLDTLAGVWVSGGNTFVLRQTMRLSGFDTIFPRLLARSDFVYGWYSAAGCVLSSNLRVYAITDDPDNFPYQEIQETLYEGLGCISYAFEPHYKSNHSESESTDREIQYCIENKIPFIAVRDGEVLIFEISAEILEMPR